MTVGLGADFRIAHCAPISLGPTRYSPSLLLPSAVFLHRHHRPAAQREENLCTRHTLVSRSGRPNGQHLNGSPTRILAFNASPVFTSILTIPRCAHTPAACHKRLILLI